jgi:hypothetical protein
LEPTLIVFRLKEQVEREVFPMMKKKFGIFLVGLMLMAIFPININAAQSISVFVNDRQIQFDVPPVLENNRLLVPLRAVSEPLGATVSYDANTKTIFLANKKTTIHLQVLATEAFKNGEPIPLDVPAKIIRGRTMVPFRFVSEALGADVNWDPGTRTVKINLVGETELTEASDIANDMAWEFIRKDIANYESNGEVKIIDSKITRLDMVKKFDGLADMPIYVFALEYRLLPDDLGKVILAGGMQVDDDGWLKETCSMGSPLLVISRQDSKSSLVGILWTGTIMEEGGNLEAAVKALLE